ncbi:hypothetical protein GDO86_002759 [Hymenochirus boettgeri]|uniref:SET domain-containing protein n=1 Tax=Hymenochirus boettgeri TaxID=247094 RepID=A0A8T2K0U2_9PIPI|nr:hypothetical protein GDO86_002759 [Hymenochirus boettgeri]
MATRTLKPGDLIISLPEQCLITTETVLESYLGKYIRVWTPPVSPLLALCTFLITERYFGDRSLWKPYLDTLPSTYSCPVYWSPEIVNLLPSPIQQKAMEQITEVQELFVSSAAFFHSLQTLFPVKTESVLTYDTFLWAWCTVNTRTVYKKHAQRGGLSAQPDVYAMAPFLDLLNHSPGVQVEAAFNEKRRCYEIRTINGCKKHNQVFICYGPHDNQRLLLEYGFVAANNLHQSVYVTKGKGQNLTFGLEGPSWKLLTAMKLLCLKPEEFTSWKKVILGSTVSCSNERDSVELVRRICLHLLDQTSCALKEASQMFKSQRL